MAYLPPIARLTQHFGLAKVPHDLKDGGQAFLDFVHSVLNADSGPLYESMKAENGKIILNFKHVGTGLVAKDGPLKGFTIAGKDQTFVAAKAEIQGNTVVVSAEGITNPQAARFGWANVPDVNLYNQEGLPASPFRTDVE